MSYQCVSACVSAVSWPRGTHGGRRGRSSSGQSWSRRFSSLWTEALPPPPALPPPLLLLPSLLILLLCRHLFTWRSFIRSQSILVFTSVTFSIMPPPTSLCTQVCSTGLQVVAELVCISRGQHLLHTGKLSTGLQVNASARIARNGLLLHCQSSRSLPGSPPGSRRGENQEVDSYCM